MMVGDGGGGWDERVPQWGVHETREFIAARGQLEHGGEHGRTMWEAVAALLRERGFRRTPDQCKCKWKSLVNRYKGKETSDPEVGIQCPFFEELHVVFTERDRKMQRQILESEAGATPAGKKLKRLSEKTDDEDDEEESEDERSSRSRKWKAGDKRQRVKQTMEKPRTGTSGIPELLQDFLQRQQRMDVQWREMMEKQALELLIFEKEWRQSMQRLEQQRLMLEQTWMERAEKRRAVEEARAERTEALLNTLLNKLLQDDL